MATYVAMYIVSKHDGFHVYNYVIKLFVALIEERKHNWPLQLFHLK